MLEYLEPFNCVQTIVIHVCKQISLNSFKTKITYRLQTYKSYVEAFNVMQTNQIWLV